MSLFLITIIGILVIFLYKKITNHFNYFDEFGIKSIKPQMMGLGLLLQKRSFPDLVLDWYEKFSKEKVIGIFQMQNPIYFIRDPKIVKQIAVKDFDHFVDHRNLLDDDVDKIFSKSLFSMKGQKWRDMRATLSPMFTSSKMKQMFTNIALVGQQASKTMRDQIKNGGDSAVEFKDLASKFTIDVIATSAFGIEVNSFKDPDNDFRKIANNVTDFTNLRGILVFMGYIMMPKVMKLMKIRIFGKHIEQFFQEAVMDVMKMREEKGIIRHDMINLLIQAKKGKLTNSHEKQEEKFNEGFATVEESEVGKSEVKNVWTDDDLAAQAFIFFLAGYDTVATTMGFLAYELMASPEAQEKLYEEIQEMEEQLDGKLISYEQLQGMKYLDQCVSETLRKWPAAPATDRVCIKDYQYNFEGQKFMIKKDYAIFIPIHGFHHDPQYFPEPHKFDPERFSPENRHKIDADTYLPFGIGPRNCIGSRFALMEVKTIFYYLLLNFKFEANEKSQIPLKLQPKPIGMKTEKGIWMTFKPRE